MSAAIKDGLKIHLQRHSSVRNVWTSRRNSITDPIATSNGFANQLAHQLRQSKSCSRYPQSIFRRTKEVEISPTSVMSSPSKFGPVSWYLSMIKSRPIVTKSITSALIYSAADFSSQVPISSLLKYENDKAFARLIYMLLSLQSSKMNNFICQSSYKQSICKNHILKRAIRLLCILKVNFQIA